MNKHVGNRDYVIDVAKVHNEIYPCIILTKCDDPWKYCSTCSLSLRSSVSLGNYYDVNRLSTDEIEVIADKVIEDTIILITLGD